MNDVKLKTMDIVCAETGGKTILLVNALFHSSLLFTFLSVFYMLYGSKIESKASNDKFASLLSENIRDMLESANKESGGVLKRGLAILGPIYDILERKYKGGDPTVKVYNTWLFRTASLVSIFMLITLGIVLIVLKFSCGHCPTSFIWDVIGENFVIFAAIAVVEYLFFKNIALKLIPAPPSLMVDEVISKIKDGIF